MARNTAVTMKCRGQTGKSGMAYPVIMHRVSTGYGRIERNTGARLLSLEEEMGR